MDRHVARDEACEDVQTPLASALGRLALDPASVTSRQATVSSEVLSGMGTPGRGVIASGVDFPSTGSEVQHSTANPPNLLCYIDCLPNELLFHVFSYLTLRQQLKIQSVSRRWRQAVRALLASYVQLHLDKVARKQSRYDTIQITSQQLSYVLSMMPLLQSFSCGNSGLVRVTDGDAVETIASLCPDLVSVDLSELSATDCLRELCLSCPDLKAFVPPHSSSDNEVAEVLSLLPWLRQLTLSGRHKHDCLAVLPPTLERLRIYLDSKHPGAVQNLVRCPRLVDLTLICDGGLSSQNFRTTLRDLPRLERLRLEMVRFPIEECFPVAGMPQLRHLRLYSIGVSDTTLQRLPLLMPALLSLDITNSEAVSEEGLLHLSRLTQLRSLNLEGVNGVTDRVLTALCSERLCQLHLPSGDRITFTEQGIAETVLHCPGLLLLGLSRRYRSYDWGDLVAQLPPERDVTLCIYKHGPMRLRQWQKGRSASAGRDVMSAVLEQRQLVDWYSSFRRYYFRS